jgi:hypothetical protein
MCLIEWATRSMITPQAPREVLAARPACTPPGTWNVLLTARGLRASCRKLQRRRLARAQRRLTRCFHVCRLEQRTLGRAISDALGRCARTTCCDPHLRRCRHAVSTGQCRPCNPSTPQRSPRGHCIVSLATSVAYCRHLASPPASPPASPSAPWAAGTHRDTGTCLCWPQPLVAGAAAAAAAGGLGPQPPSTSTSPWAARKPQERRAAPSLADCARPAPQFQAYAGAPPGHAFFDGDDLLMCRQV